MTILVAAVRCHRNSKRHVDTWSLYRTTENQQRFHGSRTDNRTTADHWPRTELWEIWTAPPTWTINAVLVQVKSAQISFSGKATYLELHKVVHSCDFDDPQTSTT